MSGKVSRIVSTSVFPKIVSITASKVLQGYCLVSEDHPEIRFRLDKLTLVVGRDPECDIIIDDPSVSRRHCIIEATPRGLRLRDLDSSNGTVINGTLITEAYLAVDDFIRIGCYVLCVQKDKIV